MNISGITNLIWVGSIGAASFLGWYLYDFKQHEVEMRQALPDEVFRKALEDDIEILPPEDYVLFGPQTIERLFHKMNWTGVPPKAPVVVKEQPKQAAVSSTKPVSSLLDVVFARSAVFNPALSQAMVLYKDASLKRGSDNSAVLGVGDHLPDPHADVFVKDITGKGVLFGFGDEEREPELVATPVVADGIKIVMAGADGALMPVEGSGFQELPNAKPYRPRETVLVKKGYYVIGTDVADSFEEGYASMIAQVQHRRHRNATTRQYDGILLDKVPANSIAAAHGVKSGDIIKSINGHVVTSVQEAVKFAKNNSEKYSTWEIVIENKGAERTVIYESPSE